MSKLEKSFFSARYTTNRSFFIILLQTAIRTVSVESAAPSVSNMYVNFRSSGCDNGNMSNTDVLHLHLRFQRMCNVIE
jgi:hypothetical protein